MKLKLKDIEFTYSSVPVLNKISFEVQDTEFIGIIGPNGSGKSTLIKCIDQILKPQGGTILLDGETINNIKNNDIAKAFAYVPQKTDTVFSLNVFDAILMGRTPHSGWRNNQYDLDMVEKVIKRMNLEDIALRDIKELSGGQQQKVLIARAIAQQTKMLLLDEPVSNLDIRHQLEVMDILVELVRDEKLSLIMVIHDLNLASRFMNRIIMMKDGNIFAAGSSAEVFSETNISQVYGVDVKIIEEEGFVHIIPFRKAVCSL